MDEVLHALSSSPMAEALRRPGALYPMVNAAHIFSIGLLVGAVTTLDLRLLGLFGTYSLRAMALPLSRMAAVGVASALATGFLLFIVRPDEYAANPAFRIKLLLVLAGIVNAGMARRWGGWPRALAAGEAPLTLKISALVSLLIWPTALVAGRWIAFV